MQIILHLNEYQTIKKIELKSVIKTIFIACCFDNLNFVIIFDWRLV